MLKKNLLRKLNMFGATCLGLITTVVLLFGLLPDLAAAQTSESPTLTPTQASSVLTILVRDSIGNPLEGLNCEVLSYGWGLQINEAFAIIARGETDKNGVVAFEVSRWPNAGYRFKFSATGHLKPAGTYILPDSDNQYRGYPGAVVGGRSETQKFVLSGSDSVFYNDISKQGQLPQYQRDPVAGMLQPRVSVMDGQDYLATAIAATSTAEARGEPTPTIPSPPSPSPKPGEIQPALTVTPGTALTARAVKSTSTSASASKSVTTTSRTAAGTVTKSNSTSTAGPAGSPTSIVIARAGQPPSLTASASAGSSTSKGTATALTSDQITSSALTNQNKTNSTTGTGSSLFVSLLLAVFGIVCLVLFWKFRFLIYPLFGIEARPLKKVNARASIRRVNPTIKKPVNKPMNSVRQNPTGTSSQTEIETKEVE